MRSHLVLWIVVCGTAAAIAGCVAREGSSGSVLVNAVDQFQPVRQSTSLDSGDVVTRVAPTRYSPIESVKHTVTEVFSILGNEALRQPSRLEERRQQIDRVIGHRVNYRQMAQRSLGDPWTGLTDTERQDFVSLYVQLVQDCFARKMDQYYDEQIVYLFERRVGSFAEVRTKMIGSKVDTWLDFRLAEQSNDWLVYDLIIDGASIVGNYRAQFARIIRDTSYAKLVEQMQQRRLVVEVFDKNPRTMSATQTSAPQ